MATVSKPRRKTSPQAARTADANGDRLSACIPASALTLAGFREWALSDEFPEHVRAAYIDGKVYIDMSNESPDTHVDVKYEIAGVLIKLNRELKLGKVYGDGVLLTNKEAGVSNNPDASFMSRQSIQAGRVRLVPRKGQDAPFREMVGTPDWVLEVISDSSVGKDTEKLREAYHRAGIPEYWLVDARGEEIVFQILHRRKKGYAAAPVREGWQKSRVFGREFRLLREKDDLDFWEYTLEIKPA